MQKFFSVNIQSPWLFKRSVTIWPLVCEMSLTSMTMKPLPMGSLKFRTYSFVRVYFSNGEKSHKPVSKILRFMWSPFCPLEIPWTGPNQEEKFLQGWNVVQPKRVNIAARQTRSVWMPLLQQKRGLWGQPKSFPIRYTGFFYLIPWLQIQFQVHSRCRRAIDFWMFCYDLSKSTFKYLPLA